MLHGENDYFFLYVILYCFTSSRSRLFAEFFLWIFLHYQRVGGRGEGETSAWATASSTFATNTNTRTHTHMYARCMHLESILCFFCSRCCAAAAAAPCSRCSCWRSSNAYEYLVCSARKMRLYRTTLLYKLHICMPYIHTHMHTYVHAHSHRNTHTLSWITRATLRGVFVVVCQQFYI